MLYRRDLIVIGNVRDSRSVNTHWTCCCLALQGRLAWQKRCETRRNCLLRSAVPRLCKTSIYRYSSRCCTSSAGHSRCQGGMAFNCPPPGTHSTLLRVNFLLSCQPVNGKSSSPPANLLSLPIFFFFSDFVITWASDSVTIR